MTLSTNQAAVVAEELNRVNVAFLRLKYEAIALRDILLAEGIMSQAESDKLMEKNRFSTWGVRDTDSYLSAGDDAAKIACRQRQMNQIDHYREFLKIELNDDARYARLKANIQHVVNTQVLEVQVFELITAQKQNLTPPVDVVSARKYREELVGILERAADMMRESII